MKTIEEQLFSSCSNGNVEELNQLLINNPQMNLNCTIIDKRGFDVSSEGLTYFLETPFNVACQDGHTEIVKILLNDNRVDINKANRYGITPLYSACEAGHIEIVKLLFKDERIDINKADTYGRTPFYVACENGRTELIKLLLNDKRVDINKPNNDGGTPFLGACLKEKIKIVKLLLNHERVDVNKPNNDGRTPFSIVCSNKIIRIVKLLLSDIRVDVNKANKYGETPFYIACENGHIEIVKYLLACRREVDINKKGNDGKVGKTGKTGLDIARESEKEKKGKWDSEEYFQQRKKKYRNIVEFLKQFKSNPIETRLKLRIKLGFADNDAASQFMMMVLLSDDYLKFKNQIEE